MESQGAGKIKRKKPVKAPTNVNKKKSKGDPKRNNKKKAVPASAEVTDRLELGLDTGVNVVVPAQTAAAACSSTAGELIVCSPAVKREPVII